MSLNRLMRFAMLVLLPALVLAACGPQAEPAAEASATPEYGSGSEEEAPESDEPEFTPEPVATLSAEEAVELHDLGWISYTAADSSRRDVWMIRPDGSDETNLSINFQNVFGEASVWSPDGRTIAYDGVNPDHDGARDIILVSLDAANPQEYWITTSEGYDCYPSYSPDGQYIAYMSERDGNRDLYIMDLEGNDIARLTDDPAHDYEPAWSPDGERIAFVSRRTGNSQIFIMDADGRNLVQLTDSEYLDWRPAWSPDGEWIAFESWREGDANIYIMRPDGSGLQRLTFSQSEDGHPHFSPDGRFIAFHSKRLGDYQLFVLEVENPENVWHLPTATGHALLPTWTGPDADVPEPANN